VKIFIADGLLDILILKKDSPSAIGFQQLLMAQAGEMRRARAQSRQTRRNISGCSGKLCIRC
jgi:hypothetical protein